MSTLEELPKVRIEIEDKAIFTRVYIDDKELKGITRVWFDSGDVGQRDGPRKRFAEHARVHVEFYPRELIVTGTADTDLIEVRPMVRAEA